MSAGQQPGLVPIDPAAEANQMADIYLALSNQADECRLNLPDDADPALVEALRQKSNALNDLAHSYTAEAIGATLQTIQADLVRIKNVTRQAQDQLGRLKDVAKAVAVASSATDLGQALLTVNPAGVLSATAALVDSLA